MTQARASRFCLIFGRHAGSQRGCIPMSVGVDDIVVRIGVVSVTDGICSQEGYCGRRRGNAADEESEDCQ